MRKFYGNYYVGKADVNEISCNEIMCWSTVCGMICKLFSVWQKTQNVDNMILKVKDPTSMKLKKKRKTQKFNRNI